MNDSDSAAAARHARLKEVFFAVQSLPRADWDAALTRECDGDAALRDEVESLLKHHKPDSVLESPMARAAARIAQVTFERGASARWNEEQRLFLAQRLRILAVMLHLVCFVASLRAFGFFGLWHKLPKPVIAGMFGGWGLLGVVSLLLLWPALSYSMLRRLEVAIMAAGAIVIFSWSFGWLNGGVRLAHAPSPELDALLHRALWVVSPGHTTHFQVGNSFISLLSSNQWSLLAGIYGMLIPNNLRRHLLGLGLMVLGTVAVIVCAAIKNPVLRPLAVELSVSSVIVVVVFGLLGIYICQRYQQLRRAVFDAQQVGQYRLTRPLGKGAMGEVYLAQHRLLHRPCAVKLIRPEQAGTEDWLLRFEREVQAMAQLTHPNTVEVYDFGRTEDGSFFYAMEYLPGKTLDALLRVHGPLPAGRAIYFLRQLCGALAEAHDKGLVHRDIKPGNIIVCERGGAQDVVKLLDFGLVHVQAELSGASPEAAEKKAEPVAAVRAQSAGAGQGDAARLTLAGQLLGTPAYMSPEQVRQQQPDTRSDIYSLGGLLYFLLTGGPPFERDTLEQLFAAHLSAVAPSVREREPAISEALDAIIARCLEKDPARRFQHVRELLAALAATKEAGEWDSDRAEAWWRQQQGIGGGQTETSIKPVSEVVPDELAMTMKSI